ncbi:MAG: PAS domain S-box protein [Sandaracinaceae bacterium]|nr:PAS domain S-box protein [Sandaracinaceae bacterium]
MSREQSAGSSSSSLRKGRSDSGVSRVETPVDANKRRLVHDLVCLLATASDYHDGVQYRHSARVALLSLEIARRLGLETGRVFYGALVHDVGAVGLEDPIAAHARRGFENPRARLHPTRGSGLVRPLSTLRGLADIVGAHHERLNGSGFPRGSKDIEISREAAVVGLADELELTLRFVPPAIRAVRFGDVCRSAKAVTFVPDVVDAALETLEQQPSLVDELFDESRVSSRLAAVDAVLGEAEPLSESVIMAELLWLLGRVIDAKLDQASGHSARVAVLAHRIALRLGGAVDPWEPTWVALLHDVGKLALPRVLLEASQALSPQDLALYQRRARNTEEIVGALPSLAHLALPAAAVHEAWNGRGFPRRLTKEAIPLASRIVAYANVFDAVRSGGRRAGGLPIDEALPALRMMIGSVLDPTLEEIALDVFTSADDVGQIATDLLGFRHLFLADDAARATFVVRDVPARTLATAGLACTVVVASDGVIREGLAGMTQITGVEEGRFLSHFAPASGPALLEDLGRVLRGSTLTSAHATIRGVVLELAMGRVGDDVVVHARGASRMWKKMHELALAHRNYLASSDAVMFTDPAARIVDVNHAFTQMYGWRREEVVGKTPKILQSGRHSAAFYRSMRDAMADPQVGAWSGEVESLTKSGEAISVELTINAIRDENGGIVGFVSSARDVTERRRALEALEAHERELEQKNAELELLSRFKSQLVALTSHDLRAPLALVIARLEALRAQAEAVDVHTLPARLDEVVEASRRLLALVGELLDLDRAESGRLRLEPRRVRAAGLVRSVVEGLLADGRLVAAPGPDHVLVADPARLEQAIANLASNALKFSPAQSIARIGHSIHGDRLTFWVEDEGPGIPEEALESVFDRYVQLGHGRANAGFGLGLAIVRHLAELHGGRAFAENRPGGGCRFAVELPLEGVALEGAPLESARLDAPLAILAGPEGSPDLARARRWLEGAGWRTVAAHRAAELARRADVEDARLVLAHESLLDRRSLRALDQAHGRGVRLVALRESEPATPDPRFAFEIVTPIVDVEIAAAASEPQPEETES